MDVFQEINSIPLDLILNKLWIEYRLFWNTLNLFENWEETGWWKAELEKWCFTNFTKKKHRAEWDRITFVQKLIKTDSWLPATKSDVVKWYQKEFNLWNGTITPIPEKSSSELIKVVQKQDIQLVFNNLNMLWDDWIKYLESRWIDYQKVKDVVKSMNWWVACRVFWEDWKPITIVSRSIWEQKFFKIMPWTISKWVYAWDFDPNTKRVIVVEWMFDFLSLYQFTKNVIWLKSAHDWHEVVKKFYQKWYEIILIPDNDDAGQSILEKYKDIKYSIFNLSDFDWVKDVNQLLIESWYWEWILDLIEEWRTKEKTNIELAFDKLKSIQKKVKERWARWVPSPFPCIDQYTQWIIEWKVYTIVAFSNTWKSQLSYEYASFYLRQWKKILFISTEVWTWDLLLYMARNLYKKNYFDLLSWKEQINIKDFSNLYLYDNVKTLQWIRDLTDLVQPDYVFIDFIQSIKTEWANKTDMLSNIALWIQELAIEKDISIFQLAQVSNENKKSEWKDLNIKWSWDFFSSSDVILWLYLDWNMTKCTITKNKFWKARKEFIVNMNFFTWEIRMAEENFEKVETDF
jgi:hypothetical protein